MDINVFTALNCLSIIIMGYAADKGLKSLSTNCFLAVILNSVIFAVYYFKS
jgi:hypothetical protein